MLYMIEINRTKRTDKARFLDMGINQTNTRDADA